MLSHRLWKQIYGQSEPGFPRQMESLLQSVQIAIVVPVLNEEAAIGETLRTLRAMLTPGDQLVVVDGGSTDRTCAIVRGFDGAELWRLQAKCFGLSMRTRCRRRDAWLRSVRR
jgi:hypothetical protein